MKTLEIANCETCYGKGWLYYGDEDTFDVEACQCSTNERETNV